MISGSSTQSIVLTAQSRTGIQSADWPDTPSATCLTDCRPVLVSRQWSNASVMAKSWTDPDRRIDVWANQTHKSASLTGLDSPLFGRTTIRQGLSRLRGVWLEKVALSDTRPPAGPPLQSKTLRYRWGLRLLHGGQCTLVITSTGARDFYETKPKLAQMICAMGNELRRPMLFKSHGFWSGPPLAVPNLVMRGLMVWDSSAPYQTM